MDDRFETRAIHAGQDPDPTTGAVVVPIYATSTYAQARPGEHQGYEYSRTDNPTRHALEAALASLEGAGPDGGAIATASGMAATALIAWLLSPGDSVVIPDDAYGGTHRFFTNITANTGVDVTVVDMTDSSALESAIGDSTKLVWVETPTNPLMRVVDLTAVNEIAHASDALVGVDNTFATPYLQRPLEMGCDLVMHSTTKYLGGHSDVIGGAIVAKDPDLVERLRYLQNATGPVAGPFDSYLVLRGLKTLGLRMERHNANGLAVARWLEAHPKVRRVFYPGLESHPDYAVATRQMTGFAGVVTFEIDGDFDAAVRFTDACRLPYIAPSLGGVESLIEMPVLMSYWDYPEEERRRYGITDSLVRLSCGIEEADDLIADLDQALSQV